MGIMRYLVRRMLNKWDENDKQKLRGKKLPDGVVAVENIPYSNDAATGHLLDVYYPEGNSGALPVLVDIHGGGFMGGDKVLNRLFGYYMAKRGFLVFNLNYRLAYFETTILGQIQDISLATQWVFEHIDEYCGDKENVILCGHSAGGVLAVMEALIAASARLQKLFDVQSKIPKQYKGVALDCGLMTFYEKSIRYWGMRRMCFAKGYHAKEYYQNMIWDKLPELSLLPRVFLISNEKDELRQMTLDFKSILEKRGVEHSLNYRVDEAEASGHMAIIYDPGKAGNSAVLDDISDYLLV